MLLLHCKPPYWRVDDFTPCVRKDLFQVFLPLLFVGISTAILGSGIVRRYFKRQRFKHYQSIPSSLSAAGHEDEDEGVDDEFAEHLSLHRTINSTSEIDVEVGRGKQELLLAVLEEFAIMALVGIYTVALLSLGNRQKHHEEKNLWAGLVTWIYVLILTSIRLIASARYPLPNLWDHATVLYTLNFVLSAVNFRTSLIHPISNLTQALSVLEFSLVSLLCVISLASRRGNKPLVLESPDGFEPSREPMASVFSTLSFSWVDTIVWKGYRKAFELSDVWGLRRDDHAVSVLHAFRKTKKTASLAYRLLRHFKRDLIIQAAWAAVGSAFTFAPTLLLRVILEYVQQPEHTPKNVAWLFVVLLFVTATISAVASGQALFIGRRICIRLRAIIIGEVYAKALRRKAAPTSEKVLGEAAKKNDKKDPSKSKNEDAEEPQDPAGQVNVGAIINLMAIDSFKVSEVCAYLHYLASAVPVQVVIAVTLLYQILGWSSIVGIGTMILLLPINYWMSKRFSQIQRVIMATTDKRIHSTNEVLQNIRIIKFFAWESRFEQVIDESRKVELKALRDRYILWSFAATIWYASPIFITYFSFLVYTAVQNKPLDPPIAFTALSLFNVLRVPLDQLTDMVTNVLQTKVSVDRVEEFLNEEETEKYHLLKPHLEDETEDHPLLGFKDASFTWGSKSKMGGAQGDNTPRPFTLADLNVEFIAGKLNVIAGPTGSGKTSMLMALLGEMTHLKGRVYLPGSHSREDLVPDCVTGLADSVAYCSQQAWLVNDTIKNNVLFASPYDEKRYHDVIVACSLERDLEILDAGDETEVGEKGIALSGGQKQRISLARALYSNSAHILLDDCLSAVDAHTAQWIFQYCIMGPLMKSRTCILVTHNIALCVPRAAKVVVMDNGRVNIQGKPETVIASGALGNNELVKDALLNPTASLHSRVPSRVPSFTGSLDLANDVSNGHSKRVDGTAPNGVNGVNGETTHKMATTKRSADESKSEGSVDWKVYQLYFTSMGSWYFWISVMAVFVLQQLGSVATSVWIRQWTLEYEKEETQTTFFHHSYAYAADYSISRNCLSSGTCSPAIPVSSSTRRINILGESRKVNVAYYLGVYAAIGLSYMLTSLLREYMVFCGSLRASRHLHKRLLHSVMRAKFRFFDSTPLGRIVNRFSKDLEAIDQEVAPVALGMVHSLASVVATVILISVVTPGFIIAGIFISFIYCLIGILYLRVSRDLKRIESIQRSPLYQHFGETLAGVATIRAYGDERRFVRDNIARIDGHNRPFFYLWACNRWLGFRVDLAGAMVSFFAGVFVVFNAGRIDSGLAGLSLTYAITFTDNVLWVVRLYAMNEQNMNSAERIKEYLEVEKEAPALIPENRPPPAWPEHGALSFRNYTTRYRPDLEPVLWDLTFDIQPAEKVGIVGRTGAGKSSLALAIFRCLEPETGTIYIDEINITNIGLQDLRERITMVPQDPTLFTGTVRNNLDPFGLYTDGEIYDVLKRVQLITDEPSQADTTAECSTYINRNIFWDLNYPITESGSNLSQGQKQLLCLTRALLKAPKIILFDEATASIDYATDAKIQDTIRQLESTTITIAHRLNTIIFYDKVLVLDAGRVVEYAHPWELIQRDDGAFRGMCEQSGQLETLEAAAKVAYEMKHREEQDRNEDDDMNLIDTDVCKTTRSSLDL